jgi:hypothetical protein
MGISIIGKEFSEAAARSYAKNPALRGGLRGLGVSAGMRNKLLAQTTLGSGENRVMYMMSFPNYEYTFRVTPASFTVEGFGAELSEIPRPYNIPIVDIKGGKSKRVSFEFLITIDNFYVNIEDEIKQIQLIADMGMPVGFDNVNAVMRENYWYIDNISFTYARENKEGKTVSASCNVSLIEYKPLRQKFILLPKFRYGKFSITKKPATTPGNTKGEDDPLHWQKVAHLAKVIAQTQGLGSVIGLGL